MMSYTETWIRNCTLKELKNIVYKRKGDNVYKETAPVLIKYTRSQK